MKSFSFLCMSSQDFKMEKYLQSEVNVGRVKQQQHQNSHNSCGIITVKSYLSGHMFHTSKTCIFTTFYNSSNVSYFGFFVSSPLKQDEYVTYTDHLRVEVFL